MMTAGMAIHGMNQGELARGFWDDLADRVTSNHSRFEFTVGELLAFLTTLTCRRSRFFEK